MGPIHPVWGQLVIFVWAGGISCCDTCVAAGWVKNAVATGHTNPSDKVCCEATCALAAFKNLDFPRILVDFWIIFARFFGRVVILRLEQPY